MLEILMTFIVGFGLADDRKTMSFECRAYDPSCFQGPDGTDIKARCCEEKEFSLLPRKVQELNEKFGCDLQLTDESFHHLKDRGEADAKIPKSEKEIWKYHDRVRTVKTYSCPLVKRGEPCFSGALEVLFSDRYKFCVTKRDLKKRVVNPEEDMNSGAKPSHMTRPKNSSRR